MKAGAGNIEEGRECSSYPRTTIVLVGDGVNSKFRYKLFLQPPVNGFA